MTQEVSDKPQKDQFNTEVDGNAHAGSNHDSG